MCKHALANNMAMYVCVCTCAYTLVHASSVLAPLCLQVLTPQMVTVSWDGEGLAC